MRCHYCDREAAVTVEKDAVRVGICESHFRERLEELVDGEWTEGLADELDIDRKD